MNTRRFLLFLLLGVSLTILQACKTRTATHSNQKEAMQMKPGNPDKDQNFEPGSKLLPKENLVKAIAEAKEAKRVWKIPVVIQRGQFGDASSSYLGVAEGLSSNHRVDVKLDDSRLGISLSERLRERCGESSTCQIWIVGTWGAVVEMPDISADSDELVFGIHSVVDAPKGAPKTNQEAFVYVRLR